MKNKFSEKDIKRMSKGKFVTRFWPLFVCLGFFLTFAGIIFIILTFIDEEINYTYLYLAISFFVVGVIGIILAVWKKTYKKETIDFLNEQLFKETFKAIKVEDRSKVYSKLTLKELKTDNVSVELIEGSIFLNVLDKPSSITDIKKSKSVYKDSTLETINKALTSNSNNEGLGYTKARSNEYIPFIGTVIVLNNFNFDLMNQIEVREIKDSISKSYFYNNNALINIDGLSDDFDVYSDNLEASKKILNKKVIEEIKKLKNKFSLGICVIFKKNSIVIELYNYHAKPSFIDYKEIYPGKRYLEKAETFNELYSSLKEFINSLYE